MKLQVARVFGACLAAASALAQAAPAVDYRLWVGHRSAEIGVGLLPAAPHAGRPLGAAPGAAMTLGVRYRLSPQTRLSLDTEISRAAGFEAAHRSRPLALELASSSPLQGLAKGTLMRAQLNADSSLTLRVRGGKIGLYLAVRLTGSE